MGEEKQYWVALNQTPGLGVRRLMKLVHYFGSPRAVWEAPAEKIKAMEGMCGVAEKLCAWRQRAVPEKLMAKLEATKVGVVVIDEDLYPLELKRIDDPPPVLYWRGRHLPDARLKIAVVGTRRATPYGLKVAYGLSLDLAAAGVGIVSGIARGIDAAAHKGALQGGGLTWGVLGCGIDVVYPPEHGKLYASIMENGCLLSEYPPGAPPDPGYFPARNRIISGLTSGTVVVEAAAKSGALITANMALEQNRDVFAVPGPITGRYSQGPNGLIKEGAKVVTGVADILEEYEPQTGALWSQNTLEARAEMALSSQERKIMDAIGTEPTHMDAVMAETGLDPGSINTVLLQLEMGKYIKRLPGGFYLRC